MGRGSACRVSPTADARLGPIVLLDCILGNCGWSVIAVLLPIYHLGCGQLRFSIPWLECSLKFQKSPRSITLAHRDVIWGASIPSTELLADRELRWVFTLPALAQLRVQGVAQPVAEQIDRHHQYHKRQRREDYQPPFAAEQIIIARADQRAQRGFSRRQSEAQK